MRRRSAAPPAAPLRRVPPDVAERARALRDQRRRTRSGVRPRPWVDVADELARQGHGRWSPRALARAVFVLPLVTHPRAPLPDEALDDLERTFREGWGRDFPDEPWPGLAEAQRRLRGRAATPSGR